MKIEAKKIQTMRSHDGGEAFSANIYIDGKNVGHIIEDGWGGGLQIEIPAETQKAIEKHMNALPEAKVEYLNNIEVYLSCIVCKLLDDRDAKRALKKPQFIKPNDKALYYFKGMKWTPETKARLEAKYPEYFFINNLPFEKAKGYFNQSV